MFLLKPFSQILRLKAAVTTRAFDRATRNPRRTQERVLLEKIRRNEDSRFGRDHNFKDIHSVEAFRREVPLTDYEYFESYIEDVRRGKLDALFGPRERVLMFAMTSGTCARPKYIPITETFLREYRLGWHVWGFMLSHRHMPAYDHHILQIASPKEEFRSEAGIPCGSISGLIAEMQPALIRWKYTPPPEVSTVKHPPSKYYLTGRLAATKSVSLTTTANPSSLLSVVRSVDDNREMVVRDVHDGTIDAGWEISAELREKLRRHLRPDARRAAELEAFIRASGRLLPKDYWPDLHVIGNWKGGSCGIYLSRYPEYFGTVPVRDIGLLASEGRMTIPISDEGSSGVLDIWSHFFEFIPENEVHGDDPVVLHADEIELEKKYYLVLTTSSGLCRYNIMDLVRVTGFYGKTPMVEFLNKGHYISSLTGEKVSEFQIVEGLRRTRADLGRGPETALFSPMMGDPPAYSLSVERRPEFSSPFLKTFLRRFEEHLRTLNMEYQGKRDSGRLGEPVIHVLKPGAFDHIKEQRLTRTGGRREQYKHCFLISELDYYRKLPVLETVTADSERTYDVR